MKHTLRSLLPLYWAVSMALLVAAVLLAVYYAPIDSSMGLVQKVLYIHLPAAINMFAGCGIVFFASLAYLWQRRPEWDAIAKASAEVTVVLGAFVLLSGMIWAHFAWGVWWTWSPRLTFSLIIWVLYVVYLLLRRFAGCQQRCATVCSFYAIVAFLNVPLFYLSVKLLNDVHPSESGLQPAMRETLLFWFVPVTMICAGATYARLLASKPRANTAQSS